MLGLILVVLHVALTASVQAAPGAQATPSPRASPIPLPQDTLVQLIYPTSLGLDQDATLTFRLFDAQTAAPVTDVAASGGRPMHLIVVRRDFQSFQHLFPEPTDAPGEYRADVTFPTSGSYLLYDELTRASGVTTLQRDELIVNETSAGPAGLAEDAGPKLVGSAWVGLASATGLRAGQESTLTFHLDNAETGQPIQDLRPYLGAAAHAVILSEDGTVFAHTIGQAAIVPGALGDGPDIALRHTFEAPGLYKIWGQFQTQASEVVTADFVVRVAQ